METSISEELDISLSGLVDIFNTTKISEECCLRTFMKVTSHRPIADRFPALLPSLENRR